jgi:excisionase family DNA binding protein
MTTICPNCGYKSEDKSEILRCPKCCYTKEFMEYAEFAKLIGTSECTVRRWEKTGRIKATRFGSRVVRIHRSEYTRLAGLPENS